MAKWGGNLNHPEGVGMGAGTRGKEKQKKPSRLGFLSAKRAAKDDIT